MLRIYLYCSILLCVFLLDGCATNANSTQMIPASTIKQTLIDKNLRNDITVGQVVGGHETNPFWRSEINNQGFKTALEESLKQANLLHSSSNSKYVLNVKLISLNQPYFALDTKVTCLVNYSLIDTQNNNAIYNKNIESTYVTKLSSMPIGFVRLKMANEGAARANIAKLINDLYDLKE